MPRKKNFNEEKVLNKAMQLFWKKGFYDTSIEDLVNYTGLNRGSLYNTFEGKKELFEHALQLYRNEYIQDLARFLRSQPDVRIGLREFFIKVIEDDHSDLDGKGCFAVNSMVELLPEDEEAKEALERHKNRLENIFEEFLKMGVDTGQVAGSTDVEAISILLYTLLTGLRVNGKLQSGREESLTSVDALIAIIK